MTRSGPTRRHTDDCVTHQYKDAIRWRPPPSSEPFNEGLLSYLAAETGAAIADSSGAGQNEWAQLVSVD